MDFKHDHPSSGARLRSAILAALFRPTRPLTADPRARQTSEICRTRRILPTRILRRSEEHTSELQSQSNLVCRLLLEKKKQRPHLLRHASSISSDDAT